MVNYDKKAKKIIGEAMRRFAKENNVGLKDIQLLVSVDPQGVPIYKLMVSYTPTEDKTVDDIYPIKFDIAGVKGIITMFIAKAMERIADSSNKPVTDINVIMYQLDEERGIELFAYYKREAMLKMVENESNIN